MGLNAYFTYTVVKGMGVAWQVALGAVFISGVAFFLLTIVGVRQLIVSSIPPSYTLPWLRESGCSSHSSDSVTPASSSATRSPRWHSAICAIPSTALAVCGLILMAALLAWGVRSAMLIGILVTTAVALVTGIAKWAPQHYGLNDLSATALQLDVGGALRMGIGEDHLRLPVHRPVRQCRHAAGGREEGGPVR